MSKSVILWSVGAVILIVIVYIIVVNMKAKNEQTAKTNQLQLLLQQNQSLINQQTADAGNALDMVFDLFKS